MEYTIKTSRYEVFGANMTINTQAGINSARYSSICQSCQCNCRLCIGHRAPVEERVLNKTETEEILGRLLAA